MKECVICGRPAPTLKELIDHLLSNHAGRCTCGFRGATRKSLRLHLGTSGASAHMTLAALSEEDRPRPRNADAVVHGEVGRHMEFVVFWAADMHTTCIRVDYADTDHVVTTGGRDSLHVSTGPKKEVIYVQHPATYLCSLCPRLT